MNYTIVLLLFVMLSVVAWGQKPETKRREATLAEQKMCADQAAKVDAQDSGKSSTNNMSHNYTSHYDPKANVCYVMIYNMYLNKDNSTFTVITIADAGGYGLFTKSPFGSDHCIINPPDDRSGDNNCHSEAEFRAPAFKRYGIAR